MDYIRLLNEIGKFYNAYIHSSYPSLANPTILRIIPALKFSDFVYREFSDYFSSPSFTASPVDPGLFFVPESKGEY